MGIIRRTALATSSPLNLTRGFGFFPANTSIDNPSPTTIIGIGATPDLTHSLFDTITPVGVYRFRGSAGVQIIAGAFFGFNLAYSVAGGTFANGTAQLDFRDDRSQGGAGFGFGFTISFSILIDELRGSFSFERGFQNFWRRAFITSGSATIDLIAITLRLLRAAGLNVPLEQIETARGLGSSGAIWGLFGSASNQLSERGSLVIRPRLNVTGNILQLIPPLRGALKALKKAGGKITVGPQINIEFPVTIEIVRLTTEDGNYNFQRFRTFPEGGPGLYEFNGGPAIVNSPDPLDEVAIVHSHRIGLQFGLELRASFSMWSIFSVSASVPIPLDSVLPRVPTGVDTLFGPFFTTLNNSDNLAHEEIPSPAVAAKLPEVVWG